MVNKSPGPVCCKNSWVQGLALPLTLSKNLPCSFPSLKSGDYNAKLIGSLGEDQIRDVCMEKPCVNDKTLLNYKVV